MDVTPGAVGHCSVSKSQVRVVCTVTALGQIAVIALEGPIQTPAKHINKKSIFRTDLVYTSNALRSLCSRPEKSSSSARK